MADAIHNLSDAVSLAIAFLARKIARRPSDGGDDIRPRSGRDRRRALVNYTTLIVIGLYLVFEAFARFQAAAGRWLAGGDHRRRGVDDRPGDRRADVPAVPREHEHPRRVPAQPWPMRWGSVAVIIGGTVILLYDWTLIR
ncbi:MAG: cation transporter [Burkholderiaceae bacterium]